MRLPQASSLGPATVAVLWSVAIARLGLSIAALYAMDEASRDPWESGEVVPTALDFDRAGPLLPHASLLAVLLALVYLLLGLASRRDPGWQSLVNRRRLQAQHEGSPELASPLLATVSGVAAALTASAVGLLLDGQPGSAVSLDDGAGAELTTLLLTALRLLAVGSAAAAGRTLLMTAGAALASLGTLSALRPVGFSGAAAFFGVLAVGAFAATPIWSSTRARLLRLARRADSAGRRRRPPHRPSRVPSPRAPSAEHA